MVLKICNMIYLSNIHETSPLTVLAPVVRKPIKRTSREVSSFSTIKFGIPGITNWGIKWCS